MLLLRFLPSRPAAALTELPPESKVIVQGTVVPHQTLPLGTAHLACVWYDNLVESMKAGIRGTRALWFVEKAECRFAGFFVEDPTGRVWVTGDPREVVVRGAKRVSGAMNKQGTERFVAYAIQPGMTVKVRGVVAARSKGDPGTGPVIRPTQMQPLEILVR